MIRIQVFRKHYFTTAIILILFICLGFFSNFLIMRFNRQESMNPPTFFAKLVDHFDRTDRVKALLEVESLQDHHGNFTFWIVDRTGKVLYPQNETLPVSWESIVPPDQPYHFVTLPKIDLSKPNPADSIIRFEGEPIQYLYVRSEKGRAAPPPSHTVVASSFAVLFLSVILGVGFALTFLFKSLQDKMVLADSVIAELQKGNLKARFPIRKMDEFGQAMNRFNQMADEIERLVERLKNVEKSRMNLLQELAHDLRTPVASLKNLLETIHTKRETIDPKIQDELMTLSLKEVDYFERLIEDLLILAQVSEPRYQADRAPLNFNELLEDESESIAAKFSNSENKIQLKQNFSNVSVETHGDPHLLRRMLRNAFDNAFSFAKKEVTASLSRDHQEIVITIDDDGNGLSKEALESFGNRRMTRVLDTSHEGRLSVGLGSVILKTVAEIHRGSVEAQNRTDSNGHVLGARITIRMPVLS